MRNWNKKILNLIVPLAVTFFGSLTNVEACEGPKHTLHQVQKDPLGRLVIVWIESKEEKVLKISIDNGPPKTLSNEGQSCISPLLEITPSGDIIVLWSAISPKGDKCELYVTMLPYGGSWSRPVLLNNNQEKVVLDSYELIVVNENEMHAFWESVIHETGQNPNTVISRKELRKASGSINSWGSAETVALLR
jgi:hypothetical protein